MEHPVDTWPNNDTRGGCQTYVLAQERWPFRVCILLTSVFAVTMLVIECQALLEKPTFPLDDPGHARRMEGFPAEPKKLKLKGAPGDATNKKHAAAQERNMHEPIVDRPGAFSKKKEDVKKKAMVAAAADKLKKKKKEQEEKAQTKQNQRNLSDMIVVNEKKEQVPLKKSSTVGEAKPAVTAKIVPESFKKVVDPAAAAARGACSCRGAASQYGRCQKWFPFDKSPWCTVAKACDGVKRGKVGLWAPCGASHTEEKTTHTKSEKNVHEIVDELKDFVDPDTSTDAAMVDDIIDEQIRHPKNNYPGVKSMDAASSGQALSSDTVSLLDKIVHQDFANSPVQPAPSVRSVPLQSAQLSQFEAARDSLQDKHRFIHDNFMYVPSSD